MVRRRDRVLVGTKNDLGLLVVDVDGSEEEDETREGGVRGDGLEPVVVEVGEDHLGLTSSENLRNGRRSVQLLSQTTTSGTHQVSKLLELHARLEGQLQLRSLDDDVREITWVPTTVSDILTTGGTKKTDSK